MSTILVVGLYYMVGLIAVNECSSRFLKRLWGANHPEAQLENRPEWVLMSLIWAFIWPLIVFWEAMEARRA